MKRMIQAATAAIFLSALAVLAGCTTAQLQTAQKNLTTACSVVNPTIQSLSTMASTPGSALAPYADTISKLATDNNTMCQAVSGLPTTTSMQTLASIDIPAVLTAVSTALPADQANIVQAALTVYQVAINSAIASGVFQ